MRRVRVADRVALVIAILVASGFAGWTGRKVQEEDGSALQ